MFTRLTTITAAQNIDDGLAFIRDTVVPTLQQQRGYAGLIASTDRAGSVLAALTVWQDEASRDASESGIAKVRDEAVRVIGGTVSVTLHEQVLFEQAKPIEAGTALLVRPIRMDPAAIDGNIAYFRAEVLPQIQAEKGYRAVRQLIDRTTGEGLAGTVFDDQASLRVAAAHAEERRADAEKRGVVLSELGAREIEYVDRA
ncbi:MAG TPA: hypothetical protein VM097_07610 [Mycobacteriales bacterium]|nr:hypothetical protein [Mycobacteriales bacterium]